MEEILAKYKAQHDEFARISLILLIIGLVGFVGGFIATFVTIIATVMNDQEPNGLVIALVVGLTVVPGVILLVIQGTYRTKWKRIYQDEIFPAFLNSIYPGAKFLPNHGLDINDIMRPKFFAYPDKYETKNYMNYKIDTTEFALSDYTLQHEHRDKDGHVTYDTYAKGRFYVFTFPRVFKNNVKVMERTSKWGRQFNGMKVVELESIDFNKKFITYCEDELAAFYILTPQVQEQMMALEKQFSGQIYYMFDDNHLYIAVNDSKDSFTFPLNRRFDEDTINEALVEILIPKRFIEALKLNADKYKEAVLDHTI